MEKTALLQIEELAYKQASVEKEADYSNIPFVKTFTNAVSPKTMDLWRRQYNWASRATGEEATKFYNNLTNAGKKATGEAFTAISGTQNIIRNMHNIQQPRIPYDASKCLPMPIPKQASARDQIIAKLASLKDVV